MTTTSTPLFLKWLLMPSSWHAIKESVHNVCTRFQAARNRQRTSRGQISNAIEIGSFIPPGEEASFDYASGLAGRRTYFSQQTYARD